MKTAVVLNQDQMGHGDRELGRKILATFLRKCQALGDLRAIVLYNSGVRLVTRASPVLVELTQLHEAGVELRPCGTCLEAFGLSDAVAVGAASNMDEILRELAEAERVLTL